jgi:four helix bundle protein
VDEVTGCFTSVGANVSEAHAAMSEQDFCRAIGVSTRETSECIYWLRIIARRGWMTGKRLGALE